MNVFNSIWASSKLDMPRRHRELTEYIDRYLPELDIYGPGTVIDIGCGPGDFLNLCREKGHFILGIDAPDGSGGMGDAYLQLCAEKCEEFQIPVIRKRALEWMSDTPPSRDAVTVINLRGSIEQVFSGYMEGAPHDDHHDARRLRWKEDQPTEDALARFFEQASRCIHSSGILLIHANGAQNEGWYIRTVERIAFDAGFVQEICGPPLLHKWMNR